MTKAQSANSCQSNVKDSLEIQTKEKNEIAVSKTKDALPEFPGGKEGLCKFIQAHKIYPVTARNEGIHGRILVKFIVNTDGSIGNAEVLKGIGSGCDEEALRIINLMPKWTPGVQNNKNVKVKFTLQIEF